MKRMVSRSCGVLLSLSLMIFGQLAQARPFIVDDVFRVSEVSNAQISPDGEWVAYEVSRTDVAKDERSTQLWMASWDGRISRQLTQGWRDSYSHPVHGRAGRLQRPYRRR